MWSLPDKRPDLAPGDRSLVTVSSSRPAMVAQITYHVNRAMEEQAAEVLGQAGSEPVTETSCS